MKTGTVNIKFYSLTLVLLNVIWGGTYVATKIPMETEKITPIALAFIRFSMTGLIMIPFLLTKYRAVKLSARDLLTCFNLGIVGFTLAYILQNIGLKSTKTMNAALEIASEPITMILLASMLLRERITKAMWIGITLSLSGVLLIILPPELSKSASSTAATSGYSILGDALVMLSTVCCSFYTIWGREIVKRVPSFVVTAYAVIIGAIFLYPCALYEGGLPAAVKMSGASWLCVLYLALFATAFAYFVWYYLLEKLNASFMGIFLNLQPLIGILLGNLLLREPLTQWTFSGGALIIAGVYIASQFEGSQKEKAVSDPA